MKITFGLVHNDDEAKLQYILSWLNEAKSIYSSNKFQGISLEVIESYRQPEIQGLNPIHSILRDLYLLNLGRRWAIYRFVSPRSILREAITFLKKLMLTDNYSKKRRGSDAFIEKIVSDKHIRLWKYFIDSDSDYLVVFEDDIVFKDTSIVSFQELIFDLVMNDEHIFKYIDLAGGLPLSDIQVNHLIKTRTDKHIIFKKGVTNTACAYLLNRPLAEMFCEIMLKNPHYHQIGIDWLINELFIQIEKFAQEQILCVHTSPTIFKHGSFTGEYNAWKRMSK